MLLNHKLKELSSKEIHKKTQKQMLKIKEVKNKLNLKEIVIKDIKMKGDIKKITDNLVINQKKTKMPQMLDSLKVTEKKKDHLKSKKNQTPLEKPRLLMTKAFSLTWLS